MIWCRNWILYNHTGNRTNDHLVVIWCRNWILYNGKRRRYGNGSVVIWCRNWILYNRGRRRKPRWYVVIWCRNWILYNAWFVTITIHPVVIWCRNWILYNAARDSRRRIGVVIWCRNWILYNGNLSILTRLPSTSTIWNNRSIGPETGNHSGSAEIIRQFIGRGTGRTLVADEQAVSCRPKSNGNMFAAQEGSPLIVWETMRQIRRIWQALWKCRKKRTCDRTEKANTWDLRHTREFTGILPRRLFSCKSWRHSKFP